MYEKGTPKISTHNPTIKEILECNDKEQLLNCNVLTFNIINKLKTEDFTWINELKDVDNPHPRIYIVDELVVDTRQVKIITYSNGHFYGLTKNNKSIYIIYNKSLPFDLLYYKNTPLPINTGGFVYNKLNHIYILINNIKDVDNILSKIPNVDISYVHNKYQDFINEKHKLNITISDSITP